ncbi:MAG TPA: hypothetical protein VEY71_09095 [Chitinophagales bacterium]|nr:hypothetical protein [Chitinophagales bacterium]
MFIHLTLQISYEGNPGHGAKFQHFRLFDFCLVYTSNNIFLVDSDTMSKRRNANKGRITLVYSDCFYVPRSRSTMY